MRTDVKIGIAVALLFVIAVVSYYAIFGGSNPAAVLYLKHEFAQQNPNTVQALVNAFYETLQWLDKATSEQIAATVPEDYFLGDKALYLAALEANRQVYSRTGIIPAEGMQSAADMQARRLM